MSILEHVIVSNPIFILTGAGISKESGLATFRDPDGVWSKYRIEDVATPEAFAQNPKQVLDFYNLRRQQMNDPLIIPNKAHKALAKLESFWPGEVLLVSQNIDNLHERGGTINLIHMHGELNKSRCDNCGNLVSGLGDLTSEMVCKNCGLNGCMRPHVVWFGEMPLFMDEIITFLERSRLFLSIGTSGNVYPASGFVQKARSVGAKTIELNLEKSEGATLFHEARYGLATELVPAIVDELEKLTQV
jgi:NAD-dependent deacetylase